MAISTGTVSKNDRTLIGLILPSIGYLLVAYVLIIAGNHCRSIYYANSEGHINWHSLILTPELLIYWILLVPVFIHRVLIYEQPSIFSRRDGRLVNNIVWQLPTLSLIGCFIIITLANLSLIKAGGVSKPITIQWHSYVAIALCVSPFYLQMVFAHINRSKERINRHFNYRNYIFFPGLSTCLFSFLAGWTAFQHHSLDILWLSVLGFNFYYLVSYSSLNGLLHRFYKTIYHNGKGPLKEDSKIKSVLLGFVQWRKQNQYIKPVDWLVTFIILLFFGYVFYIEGIGTKVGSELWHSDLVILATAIMMTFVMGLTETWWFVKDQYNRQKFTDDDLTYYSGKLNTLTAFYPLLIPICIFNQYTNNNFYFIFFYSMTLVFIWTYFQNKFKSRNYLWRWIRITFGIVLPILMAISFSSRPDTQEMTLIPSNKIGGLFIILGFILSIMPIIAVTIRSKVDSMASEYRKNHQGKIVLFLTSFILLVPLLAVWLFDIGTPIFSSKVNTLIPFYVIFIVVIIVEFAIKASRLKGVDVTSELKDDDSPNSTIFNEFCHVMVSGRPFVSIIAGIASGTVLWMHSETSLYIALIKTIPISVVTMIGFVANDIFDIKKDQAAGKMRPIAMGKLTRSSAIKWIVFGICAILIFELIINGVSSLLVIGATLTAVIMYSPVSNKSPLFKGLYTAVLCTSPFFYAYVLSSSSINYYSLVLVCGFIFGRELWLDKIDYETDINFGLKTIPFYLGSKLSKLIAVSTMLTASIFTILLVPETTVRFVAIGGFVTLILAFFVSLTNEVQATYYTRITLFLGAVALALS